MSYSIKKVGWGESTITCNLAAISAWQGKRTLVIDLDSQGNSTRYLLGADMPEDLPNVAEFFEQSLKFTVRDKPASESHRPHPLGRAGRAAVQPPVGWCRGRLEWRREYRLAMRWRNSPDYDQIYIDTPPALNFYSRCALIAAQGCLIPLVMTFSRRALYTLLENVAEIGAGPRPGSGGGGRRRQPVPGPCPDLPQRLVQTLIDEGPAGVAALPAVLGQDPPSRTSRRCP
jgi:chromosome partitioning protein